MVSISSPLYWHLLPTGVHHQVGGVSFSHLMSPIQVETVISYWYPWLDFLVTGFTFVICPVVMTLVTHSLLMLVTAGISAMLSCCFDIKGWSLSPITIITNYIAEWKLTPEPDGNSLYCILTVICTALINRSLAKNGGELIFSHSITLNLKVRQGPNRGMH